jgi:hypothetical protein
MKRIVSVFLALAVSATLVFVVTSWKHSVHAQGVSSVATLTGNYGSPSADFSCKEQRKEARNPFLST